MKNLLLYTSIILILIWGCKTKPPQKKEEIKIQYTNLVYPKNLKNARDSFMWLYPRTETKEIDSKFMNIQDSLRYILWNRKGDSITKSRPLKTDFIIRDH
jgi:hypothetical protein